MPGVPAAARKGSRELSPALNPPLAPAISINLRSEMLSSVVALTPSFTAPAGVVRSTAPSAVSLRMGVSDMCAVARMQA